MTGFLKAVVNPVLLIKTFLQGIRSILLTQSSSLIQINYGHTEKKPLKIKIIYYNLNLITSVHLKYSLKLFF
jgi:hypothetical protein